MPGIDHILLTRFNLPTAGVEGVIRAREGWLRDRVALFERYCLPSVARQTAEDLTWIVYLDPESPQWLLDRLAPYAAQGLLHPVLRESVSRAELVGDIEARIARRGSTLLTTNVDNDDGLAIDFAERLQAVSTTHPRAAVYLARGLVKSPEGVYLHTDRRSAFCSVRESWEDPVTAWSEYHNELPNVMPAIEVTGAPAWLQVVHGANVSNRVRGRLVSPASYRGLFPELLDDVADPSPVAVRLDHWARHPARSGRDAGRAAARRTALRVLGKDRYQEVKQRLSAVARGR